MIKWQNEFGEQKPLNRLDDSHLVNVYYHVKNYGYPPQTVKDIRDEIKRRKLKKEFIDGAPYPWFDSVDRIWRKWSEEEQRSVKVG